MKQKLLNIIVLSTLCSSLSYAQVTIGSNMPPVDGALLDLKTETDGSSKLGLGLPRVELQALDELKIGAQTYTDNIGHTGLIVYNVKEDLCLVDPIYEGMYVWTGTEWQYLGKKTEEKPSPEVYYYEDTRPHGGALAGSTQTYPYRQFGAAGEWMLENMRYIPDADASVQLVASAGTASLKAKNYTYPQVEGTVASPGTKPTTWSEVQGLLYSHSAATLGAQDGVSVNQGHGQPQESTQSQVQGICPSGWHIPTDREFNELEEELYNNAGKYSTYTAEELADVSKWNPISKAGAWLSRWNTDTDYRGSSTNNGGHGYVFKAVCNLPEQSNIYVGKSLSVAQGGFNILLVGYTYNGSANFYGSKGYLWSSSIYSSRAWYRAFDYNSSQVRRNTYNRYALFSVRCKKDNP